MPSAQALLRIHYDLKQEQQRAAQSLGGEVDIPCTHFVETAPSLLQEMPWILHMDYKVGVAGGVAYMYHLVSHFLPLGHGPQPGLQAG